MKNWYWLALALPVLCAGPAQAQALDIPQSHSVEQADARLKQVELDREAVEAEYAASEQVCYARFFVNACLDKAKERRRMRLSELRSVEVEASSFKRRQAVELRDRELEDRAQKDAAEAAYLAANPKPPKPDPETKPGPKPAAVSLEQRQAEFDASERARAAREAAEAPRRAARAAEFERKKAESEKRQAAIAAKLAEKAAKKQRAAEGQKP